MLYYQAVCRGDFGTTPPFTIFVSKRKSHDALVWNQGIQTWQYDPERVVRFTGDYRNDDRWQIVDRTAAEDFARELAADGSSELPTEDWIEWFFSWKGDPPDHEDTSWDDDEYVRQIKTKRALETTDSDGCLSPS
ncbi:hypothetical protein [Nocardia yamanashiensis]|uniref:hypothetical protein n=1 Tax=Nocardia yamanashiensis TaxID=209247 RepID=UPI000834A388|nr:hypothetical protein [Nocardia yamanashiensis]